MSVRDSFKPGDVARIEYRDDVNRKRRVRLRDDIQRMGSDQQKYALRLALAGYGIETIHVRTGLDIQMVATLVTGDE